MAPVRNVCFLIALSTEEDSGLNPVLQWAALGLSLNPRHVR
jgi:hypothetical protein